MVLIIIKHIVLISGGKMNKNTTQKIKGVAILIMIAHHFIVFSFLDLSRVTMLFGESCKICVAMYAFISGYGYFFSKNKTIIYSIKKIWKLLEIYWISLFTLFIPIAVISGWKITFRKLIVQMFGLLPNLNWFAWYVFFYIFCMLVMPLLCKYKVFRYRPSVNLLIMILIPYCLEIICRFLPWYDTSTIIHDLYSCFLYFPCFLIGFWCAENKVIEKSKELKFFKKSSICIIGVGLILLIRVFINSIVGLLLDVFYVLVMICCIVNFFENTNHVVISKILSILGKYSTGMWFFHAVFFSTYISRWFQPILKIVRWSPLMFIWLVVLSLCGAIIYQKILKGFCVLTKIMKRSL